MVFVCVAHARYEGMEVPKTVSPLEKRSNDAKGRHEIGKKRPSGGEERKRSKTKTVQHQQRKFLFGGGMEATEGRGNDSWVTFPSLLSYYASVSGGERGGREKRRVDV